MVTPAAIASAEAFGVPTIQSIVSVLTNAIASAEGVGNPTIAAKVTAQPTAIGSAEALGFPTLTWPLNLVAVAIPSAEAFGQPTALVILVGGGRGATVAVAAWVTDGSSAQFVGSSSGSMASDGSGSALIQPRTGDATIDAPT
jgi:hypothetical protein